MTSNRGEIISKLHFVFLIHVRKSHVVRNPDYSSSCGFTAWNLREVQRQQQQTTSRRRGIVEKRAEKTPTVEKESWLHRTSQSRVRFRFHDGGLGGKGVHSRPNQLQTG